MAARCCEHADALELDDIQGLLARGYGTLPYAAFLLLRIADGRRPRAHAAALGRAGHAGRPAAGRRGACNVALTATGHRGARARRGAAAARVLPSSSPTA